MASAALVHVSLKEPKTGLSTKTDKGKWVSGHRKIRRFSRRSAFSGYWPYSLGEGIEGNRLRNIHHHPGIAS